MVHVACWGFDEVTLTKLRRKIGIRHLNWQFHPIGESFDVMRLASAESLDVIVLGAPLADGVQVLDVARHVYPEVFSVVFSEQGRWMEHDGRLIDADVSLDVHADLEEVVSVLDAWLVLQRRVRQAPLRRFLSQWDDGIRFPPLFTRLSYLLRHVGASLSDVAECLETEPELAEAVVDILASTDRVSSEENTVISLLERHGLDVVLCLVFHLEMSRVFLHASFVKTEEFIAHHGQSILRARRFLSLFRHEVGSPLLFTTALLQDIGELFQRELAPTIRGAVELMARTEGSSLAEAERSLTGFTHAEIGAYFLDAFGLPFEVVFAVLTHHDDEPPPINNRLASSVARLNREWEASAGAGV